MTQTGNLHGQRVKRLREARGLTQEELGQLLGVEGRQIVRYEKPDANPSALVVIQLATALGTSSDYLLGLTDDPKPKDIAAELSAEELALIIALRSGETAQAVQAFAALTRDSE